MREVSHDLVIVITGARRVGKTYLLRDLLNTIKSPNSLYLDLEKPENLAIFKEENFEAILTNLKSLGLKVKEKKIEEENDPTARAFLFLDEIQVNPKLPPIIKYFSDHYQIKFIVTGSSSFYLKNLFSESLSGRKLVFRLFPLDFGEYLVFRNLEPPSFVNSFEELLKLDTQMIFLKYQRFFEDYLKTGGFPQVVLEGNTSRQQKLLKDILYSYLALDVKNLSDFRNLDEFEKLVQILPARVGQKIDLTKIASEVGISRPTVKNYLNFLEDTFIVSQIKPFSLSKDREISATPKLYFCDPGLANALFDLSAGQKLENTVFNHLVKHFEIRFYQKKSGAEIDFVADAQLAFETKVFGDYRDLNRLSRLVNSLKLSSGYVFSQKISHPKPSQILPALLLGFWE